MQKNLYFQHVLRRDNILKDLFYDGFVKACSYPRLFLEVFIRRNFGERYFNFASVLTTAFLLAVLPLILHGASIAASDVLDGYSTEGQSGFRAGFWGSYFSWYLAIAGFVYVAWQRRKEIKRNPSVFDFGKFSLYSGDINPVFQDIPARLGWPVDIRKIETLYEPTLFMAGGAFLWICGQNVGMLILVCGVFYALGYAGMYRRSDNFIMDKIDQIIMNEEMESALVGEVGPDETRGVRFHATKPDMRAHRQKLADSFIQNDDKNDPISCA